MNNYLEQLFDNGYVEKEVDIIPKKLIAILRTINGEDQLEVERSMSVVEGSRAYVLHEYSIRLLSRTLIEYKAIKFKDFVDAETYIRKLPSLLIEKLILEQNILDKELANELNLERVEKSFFGQKPAEQESEQSLEGSTPGKEDL
jgi:hypothetical protein